MSGANRARYQVQSWSFSEYPEGKKYPLKKKEMKKYKESYNQITFMSRNTLKLLLRNIKLLYTLCEHRDILFKNLNLKTVIGLLLF